MSNVKNYRLGLIGLCVAAGLALMAIGASGAQAAGCTAGSPTLKPCWMVNGSNITANLEVELTAAPEEIEVPGDGRQKVALLLTETALKAPLWISCSIISSSGNITLQAGGVATGALSFNVCKTYLKINGEMELVGVCAPEQPIVAGGTLEIALHEGVAVAKATGAGAGGRFVIVKFAKKTGCILEGENYEVKGTAWLEDCNKLFETEELEHLLQENKAAAAKLGGLTFGGNPASIDGSALVKIFEKAVMLKTFSGLAG